MFLIFMTFLLHFFPLEGRIIETRHIDDVLQFIDEQTWFLVDLDNCMFEGAQAYGHANWFYDEIQKRMQNGMTQDEAIRDIYPTWIKVQKVCRVKPLEDNFIPILKKLQEQGITVMGLTHRQPLIADSTIRQVCSLNFDFKLTAPSQENFEVSAETPALYANGILFVGDYNKKIDVFKTFISMLNVIPKKIVFIDDKRKNIEELETFTSQGIEYIGMHYRAIEYVKPIYVREIAEFQSKFLDEIMSNEDAKLLMERSQQSQIR